MSSPPPDPAAAPPGDGSARAVVLGRIRAALAAAGGPPPAAPPPLAGRVGDGEPLAERFVARVTEYRATVHRIPDGGVGPVVAALCRQRGARRLGIPPDLPAAWRPTGLTLVEDDGLAAPLLDGLDGALTGCAVAIAETGTVVLDGGAGQGRRALSLVPDWHCCVVVEAQLVAGVPDAVAALAAAARAGRPLTWISGPSATSDIELSRVEGVHGPRTLDIVLVAAP